MLLKLGDGLTQEKEGDIQSFPNVPYKTTLEFVLADMQLSESYVPTCSYI